MKKLNNLKVMDYLVFIVVSSILIFTAITLYFHYKHGIPVSEIYTAFFGVFAIELLAMAGISISNNIKKKEDDYE